MTIFADSFKFLASLRHDFGPWASYSALFLQMLAQAEPSSASAGLGMAQPEAARPRDPPRHRRSASTVLQCCSPSRAT